MNCKHCHQELEKGVTLCPACGTDNSPQAGQAPVPVPFHIDAVEGAPLPQTPAEAPETGKRSTGKLTLAIGACVVLLAILVALIVGGLSAADDSAETTPSASGTTEPTESSVSQTEEATIPQDGEAGTITEKGTYTPEDSADLSTLDAVVATMGGQELTNSQLQIYYALILNQFLSSEDFYYLYYYGGIDYTQPLDTQLCYYDETLTWQQYFLQESLNAWKCYQALALEAEAAGFVLNEEYQTLLDDMPQQLEEDAAEGGYASVDEMITSNMGPGARTEDYLDFQRTYYLGYAYYQHLCEDIQPTAEEIEKYFTDNEDLFAAGNITKDTKTVDVRHILISPDGGTTDSTGTTTYSDEEWAACLAETQRIRDEWLAGAADEEFFAELAEQYSEDPGSNTSGGLYTDVAEGDMTENFNNWCFDASRKAGDYGLVQTSFGYHIMYYSGENYPWAEYAEYYLVTELTNQIIDNAVAKYPMEANYSAMLLYFSLA